MMATPINLDVACELTEAMILDEATCVGAGADNLDALCNLREYGALLDRIRWAIAFGDDLEPGGIERVTHIARWWAEEPEGCSDYRLVIAEKARKFLRASHEAA
jgi:hypothetical protein